MKNLKKVLCTICLLIFSAILFAGCGENKDIVSLRKDFSAFNLNNYYGYKQIVTITSGESNFESYIKDISYNGQSVKVYSKQNKLNQIGVDSNQDCEEILYFVDNGYKIENINGSYTKTDRVEISLNFGLKFKEDYFENFSVKYDGNKKSFNAKISKEYFSAFLNKSIENVKTMTFDVIVINDKLDTCLVQYVKDNNINVEIKTNFYSTKQNFNLPSYN